MAKCLVAADMAQSLLSWSIANLGSNLRRNSAKLPALETKGRGEPKVAWVQVDKVVSRRLAFVILDQTVEPIPTSSPVFQDAPLSFRRSLPRSRSRCLFLSPRPPSSSSFDFRWSQLYRDPLLVLSNVAMKKTGTFGVGKDLVDRLPTTLEALRAQLVRADYRG